MLSSAVVTHPARVRYYCPASATPPRDCNGRAGVFEPPTKAPRTVVTHRYQIVHFNSKSSSFWRFWRNIWHLVHFQFRKNTQKRVFRNSGNSRQIEVVLPCLAYDSFDLTNFLENQYFCEKWTVLSCVVGFWPVLGPFLIRKNLEWLEENGR